MTVTPMMPVPGSLGLDAGGRGPAAVTADAGRKRLGFTEAAARASLGLGVHWHLPNLVIMTRMMEVSELW